MPHIGFHWYYFHYYYFDIFAFSSLLFSLLFHCHYITITLSLVIYYITYHWLSLIFSLSLYINISYRHYTLLLLFLFHITSDGHCFVIITSLLIIAFISFIIAILRCHYVITFVSLFIITPLIITFITTLLINTLLPPLLSLIRHILSYAINIDYHLRFTPSLSLLLIRRYWIYHFIAIILILRRHTLLH